MYATQSRGRKDDGAHSPAATQATHSVIQRKLTVGAVDDPFEREADATADKVMRMPETPMLQRKCAVCDEEEQVQRRPLTTEITPFIQRKGGEGGVVSDALSSQIESSRGSGSPMPDSTRNFMESRFGADFSDVRLHTGSDAVQMNRELNAQAFTVGKDVYFNAGKYSPESEGGKHLLAHELTHTVQQSSKHIHKKSWEDDERTCISMQKILVQLIFDDMGNDKWTETRKNTFKNDLKLAIETTFNAGTYRVSPINVNSYPCQSQGGFLPRVQIDFIPDGQWSISEDWEVDVAANSKGSDPPTNNWGAYGDLDEADNTPVGKLSSAVGVKQISSVHEFGHFLGLDHPGKNISGVNNEYAHVGTDKDGHMVDGPNDLMGSGMGMRTFYYDSWVDHLLFKYSERPPPPYAKNIY